MSGPVADSPHEIADARRGLRHVFVRDLVLPTRIGVNEHEREGPQPLRINIDLAIREEDGPVDDKLASVVCYETIVRDVKSIVARGHVNLVETLAERIAALCLADPRVELARVRIEKFGAIPEAASVGVEIARERG